MSAIPETTKVFFDDILEQEFQGELEQIGTCTIGLCYRPGVISFGVWVMCREHGHEYTANVIQMRYRCLQMTARKCISDLQDEGLIGSEWDPSLGGYPVLTGEKHGIR